MTEAGAQLYADGFVGNTSPRLERVREQMANGQDMNLWGEVVRALDAINARIDGVVATVDDIRQGVGVNSGRVSTTQDALAETTAQVEELGSSFSSMQQFLGITPPEEM